MLSFGGTIDDNDGNPQTADTVTMSLWVASTLYECSYDGMDADTEYICSEDAWTITTDVCGDGSSDYKLVLDNSQGNNAVNFDSVFLTLSDADYLLEAWCISDDFDVCTHYVEHSPNDCATGYTAYDVLGLDNQYGTSSGNCAPGIANVLSTSDQAILTMNAFVIRTSALLYRPGHYGDFV